MLRRQERRADDLVVEFLCGGGHGLQRVFVGVYPAVVVGGDGCDGGGHAEEPAVVGVAANGVLEGVVCADDLIKCLQCAAVRASAGVDVLVALVGGLDLVFGGFLFFVLV